jgi:ferritin
MKMPEELEKAFNDQVTMELASANAYLQMSSYFSQENFDGMSRWMRSQASEERAHADLFLDFILDRGGIVTIGDVAAPKSDFTSALDVFETALAQEEAVTAAIHDLYRMASDLGDLSSFPFLQSFISEQNEEEAMVSTIVERLRLAEGESGPLFMLDSELGAREG